MFFQSTSALMTFALIACTAFHGLNANDDVATVLGNRGKLLLEETFDGTAVPENWAANTGKLEVIDGALNVCEQKADKHAAAFRRALPTQDCAVQFDFKIGSAKFLHCGFDPKPGELKKKGHLFSVVVTATSITVLEHIDKADKASKNVVHIKKEIELDPNTEYTLLIECKGEKVNATLSGIASVSAKASDFAVKKPGLVFRVSGMDDHAVVFDNVKVWELK